MHVLKGINTAFSFVLEMTMLAAFGYWGYATGASPLARWGLAIGLPLAVVVAWGAFFAPKARWRLSIWPGVLLSLGLFLLAAAALFHVQKPMAATMLAIGALMNRVLVLLWHEW